MRHMDEYDYSVLASAHGEELDDMLVRRDYICGACGYSKDWHPRYCIVQKLLATRIRMVPMIISR